jgi:cytochrome c peroxidase
MKPRRISWMSAVALGSALLMPVAFVRADDVILDASPPPAERKLVLPDKAYGYASTADWPAHFKRGPNRGPGDDRGSGNRVTDDGAALGRVLFYDTRVSANNSVACASCHSQKKAFADPRRFSKGHEGKETDRHAPNLVNLRFNPTGRFFWDERAASLEEQVLMPIQSKVEMGNTLDGLLSNLGEEPAYPALFKKAFGDSQITSPRVAKALSQFVRSMVSCRSKFDEGLAKVDSIRDDFPNLTSQENRGRAIFARNCANCHAQGGQQAGMFLNQPRNNGLDTNTAKADGGVGDVTFKRNQIGLFKSPSLRNVEVTGPYMHDGRFTTLEQVVEHYSTGVKTHPNADGRLRRRLNLTTQEKASLVAFLKTLTDTAFLNDPKFSDPFQGKETP